MGGRYRGQETGGGMEGRKGRVYCFLYFDFLRRKLLKSVRNESSSTSPMINEKNKYPYLMQSPLTSKSQFDGFEFNTSVSICLIRTNHVPSFTAVASHQLLVLHQMKHKTIQQRTRTETHQPEAKVLQTVLALGKSEKFQETTNKRMEGGG